MPVIPAHWKATLVYGDNDFGLKRDRSQTFPGTVDGENSAQDWVELNSGLKYQFTIGGVQFTILPSMISHTRVEFVEEVVTS